MFDKVKNAPLSNFSSIHRPCSEITTNRCKIIDVTLVPLFYELNPSSANRTKSSNRLKQFVGYCRQKKAKKKRFNKTNIRKNDVSRKKLISLSHYSFLSNTLIFYKQLVLTWQIAKQLSGLNPFSLSSFKNYRSKKS